MKIITSSVLKPPSEKRILEFEENCNITLPESFKGFIRQNNGAVPIKNTFRVEKRSYLIERFLCLLDIPEEDVGNGLYDIEVVLAQIDTRLSDDADLVGANIIPIASLFAGDFVCLDCRQKKEPVVVIWYHEESDDLKPVTRKVADSFTEFLGMLRED